MALSTRSLRPSLPPALPDPEGADLDAQIAVLQKQREADDRRRLAELRQPWIATRLKLAGEIAADGAATRAAEVKLHAAEKALELAKAEHAHQVASQIQRNCVRQREQKEIESKLDETAPACIMSACAELEARFCEAIKAEKTREIGHDLYETNSPSIRKFLPAASKAAVLIRDLRLTAIDTADASKQIAAILKRLPRLNLDLVEVER